MKIKIAQLVVSKSIETNLEKILTELRTTEKDEWIVFPEAILSGYYPQEEFYTKTLDWKIINQGLGEIEEYVRKIKCNCLLGSATFNNNSWYNSIYTFSYLQKTVRHDKKLLSKLDQKHFSPGEAFERYSLDGISYGMFACRELIFPRYWSEMKDQHVQVIFHLNNAIQPHDVLWKHILITRAIENSIFVVSVNNADFPQKLASYVIDPSGEILIETQPEKEESRRVEIELDKVIPDLDRREDY